MRSLFPTRAESDRLRYEPLHESRSPMELYELHRSGELDAVMRPLGDRVHETPKQSLDELTAVREKWESGDRATYAIVQRADDEFVGVAELWLEWDKRTASFGTWIRKPFWGQGYSGERAGVLLAIAFDWLDLAFVSVGHEPDNDQSRRAIEKYVAAYGGQQDAVLRNWLPPGDTGGPRDLRTYSISQLQWREAVTEAELAKLQLER
ncbi:MULTISPECIES: GNAT family N-acetyltransferase [unclassified Haladaptatus]|uniref:GNAT family N-acetyltransferase n=1 Tax=unclassified Haladaptatus TaxID=2622732 RepID=UPI0023E80D27|nr:MULTISPECIES: GNAT family N-acetyltransferase [unclassified Haladaptatus]